MFSCPKHDVIKVRWKTNFGMSIKHNSIICKTQFDSNKIQSQIIKIRLWRKYHIFCTYQNVESIIQHYIIIIQITTILTYI